jgi:hypothetical protein
MSILEYESSIYLQPRETKYVIDFGKIFENESDSQQVAGLMANYISAMNLRPDILVHPHFVRLDPLSRQKEYPLVENLGKILEKPTAKFYEYDNETPSALVGAQPMPGQRIIIVDGGVRTGSTILRTAQHLRRLNSEIRIQDAVVYMARPEGRKLELLRRRLTNEGVQLHALISARDLLNRLFSSGYLSEAKLQEALTDEDFI